MCMYTSCTQYKVTFDTRNSQHNVTMNVTPKSLGSADADALTR